MKDEKYFKIIAWSLIFSGTTSNTCGKKSSFEINFQFDKNLGTVGGSIGRIKQLDCFKSNSTLKQHDQLILSNSKTQPASQLFS